MIFVGRTNAKASVRSVAIDNERRLRDRWRLDTVVVATWNYAEDVLVNVIDLLKWFATLLEIKFFGFRGEYGRKSET